jgi:electron transport complex protein RnfD
VPDRNDASPTNALPLLPAPHIGVRLSTARMTWMVCLCLLLPAAWGIFLFGLPALGVLGVSLAAAALAELAATLPFRRFTLADGSAVLTGCIVALLMPAGVPLFVPAAASAFGILVIKQSFGGLGKNWMNPAMGGIVFASLSWPGLLTRWVGPRGGALQDAVLPPLEALRAALAAGTREGSSLAILNHSGYAFSGLDAQVVGWVNSHVMGPLGLGLQPGSFDVLVGHVAGGIGTVSIPLLLLGAWYLLSRGVIRWHLPVAYLGTFFVLSAVFGGLAQGRGWFAGGPIFQLFSGSLVLGAFFAAPDPVTSPLTNKGKWVFGIGLGVLTFFLRCYGSTGDGVASSIVLGNCAAPLLDRWASRRRPGRAGETPA